MNALILIKTNTVTDIPKAIRDLADIMEKDIDRMGVRANALGMFDEKDSVSGDFDYQISQENFTSLCSYLNKVVD